ncbi:hypothetical protein AMS68_003181 [Peltaster fructicola]|uniref:Uncharacterized protein n=1 Tax=Peltaster fructicola TaxID=286661 RepID=A0A6H0XSF2_9PEZI|nr:hypothetical protein AMS68_003181 [Peltaster fructicola]
MVKLSLFVALVSVLAYTSAEGDYDDFDYDDCEELEETTLAAPYSTSWSTATASASSSSITSTCPRLPAPTTTDTVISYSTITANTEASLVATTIIYASTVISSVPQPIDQTGVTYLTATVAATTKTSYYGPTFTSVVFDVVPAETTVTVPRAADFTPLKCESAYVGPFVTSTISYTTTVSIYSYVTVSSNSTTTNVIVPATLIFPTVTINSTATLSLRSTTTVTSTRNDPTSTIYAACQGTDNVTPDAPPSKYQYLGQPVPVIGTYSSVVAAIDQVDCCAMCQANEQCTASAFYTKPILGEYLDTYLVNTACQLFLKNDTTSATCDTSFIGATMSFDYPEIINYYSNGPCGQFNFTYDLPRIFHDTTS